MVVHQIEQREDGTLVPVVNDHVKEKISHKAELVPAAITETVKFDKDKIQFSGDQYELVEFEPYDSAVRIEADFSGFGDGDMFGISFAPNRNHVGEMSFVFNVPENRVEFYNTPKLFEEDAQSFMDLDLTDRDSVHMTLLLCDGVASLYVDDEIALTARMYRSQGTDWQIYAIRSGVTVENVAVYQ